MVNTVVHVIDPKNTPIEGIPIKVHVVSCKLIGGASNDYWLYGETDANGNFTITNAQAYCQFIAYANYDFQNPNWSSGQGTTSTTFTQGGYITISLQPITQVIVNQNGTLSCPNGYSLKNIDYRNVCVQNATAIPQIQISYLEIIMIIIIIAIIITIIKYARRK